MSGDSLAHFLSSPEKIPEGWKGERIFFWETLGWSSKEKKEVLFLQQKKEGWRADEADVDSKFDPQTDYAAKRA